MKKIYLLASLLLTGGIAMAQTTEYRAEAKELASELVDKRIDYHYADRAPGDIVWADSFEVASNWLAGGATSPNDSIHGWTVNTVTGGWFFPATGDMGTSGSFARFINGENDPTDAIPGPFTFEYVGGPNNGDIDLTGIPAPHLEFEQYGARFIVVQAVEISTDGGNTWFQVMTNDDIPPNTANGGGPYGQPETRRFNMVPALTAAGGSLANVKIRLFWDGAQNGPNFNYIDYGWFVDNIRILEGQDYEAELRNPKYRWGVTGTVFPGGLDYHFIPVNQLSEVEFSAEIVSNGGQVQTGANVSADITGAATFSGVSPSSNIAVGGVDSFVVAPTFTPTVQGIYNLEISANQTNPDFDLTNNTFSTSFQVTDAVYGRDNGTATGGITNFSGNGGQSFSIGNLMEIFNDWSVTHMDIVVTNTADNLGQTIFGTIYRFDGTEYLQVAVTEEYVVQQADLQGAPIRLRMLGPGGDPQDFQVFAGDDLLVMAAHLGGTDVRFATAQAVESGTVRGVSVDGSIGSLADPEAVMVRLVMPENLNVAESEYSAISVAQNMPNPFSDNTFIKYTLNEAANVSLEIIDLTGKVVATYNEGTRGAGEHNITIGASQLSDGVYFYNFKAGDYSVTKRMVVNK